MFERRCELVLSRGIRRLHADERPAKCMLGEYICESAGQRAACCCQCKRKCDCGEGGNGVLDCFNRSRTNTECNERFEYFGRDDSSSKFNDCGTVEFEWWALRRSRCGYSDWRNCYWCLDYERDNILPLVSTKKEHSCHGSPRVGD